MEEYDAYEPSAAGEGPCVDWAGTFHEVRSGGYTLLAPAGARHAGEVHFNGVVDGFVELIPEDPMLRATPAPTARRSTRSPPPRTWRTTSASGNTGCAASSPGTDGSRLTISLSGKISVNGRGDVVISRDEFMCA